MVAEPSGGAWAVFKEDLTATLGALGRAPAFVVLAIGLSLVWLIPPPFNVAALPLALFSVGWTGCIRTWYLRLFRGSTLTAAEVWELSWRFLGRYVVLGLIVGVPLVPIFIAFGRSSQTTSRVPFLVAITIYFFVLDVVLTFVVPALAYTTNSVVDAFTEGVGTLKEHWSSCRWHALAPPLTLLGLSRAIPSSTLSYPARIPVSIAAAAIALAFRGVIAHFYLKVHPGVGDRGAADMDRAPKTDPRHSNWEPPR